MNNLVYVASAENMVVAKVNILPRDNEQIMELTFITDYQIHRAHIQPKSSLELNAERIAEFVHLFWYFLKKLPADLLEKRYWTSLCFRLHYHGWV